MKFNRTLPLALALSVGAAGAVMAQTAATPTPTTPSTQPAMNYGQPQANVGQTQAPTSANQAQMSPGQPPPAARQAQQAPGRNATSTIASGGNEQVRMAQQRLHQAGLYNGPEDGIMDPDTRAALARYQEQNGLQRSESLDPETLAKLEGGQTAGYGSTTPSATATPPAAPSATLNPYAGAVGGNAGKSGAR